MPMPKATTIKPTHKALKKYYAALQSFRDAKDTDDNLDAEIQKKIDKGYPLSNTIFEDTRYAVLYQGGQERGRFDLTKPKDATALLNEFFAYTEPEIDNFHRAVEEFQN